MPITRREDKWYWGSKGPYNSRKQAEEVERAAYASGYGVQQKIEKLETGAPMDGTKRQLTATEIREQERKIQIHKEDGGGEGFGGTAFTSTNAGIFNPTFGEKKKKKTGVERLHDFVTESSPLKLNVEKMHSHGTVANGKMGPVRIDWDKRKLDVEDVQKVVAREGEQNQDSVAKDAKDKQRSIERTVEDVKDDEKEKELRLQYGYGSMGGQDDELHRANPKDKLSRNPRDDEGEEEEESTEPEEIELKSHLTYGKMMRKSAGWDKLFKDLIDEL